MGPIATLDDLWRALWRRALLIVAIAGLGTGLSLLYALSRDHTWQATAVIQIEAPRVASSLTDQSTQSPSTMIKLIEQQVMSRDNIAALIDQFKPFPEDMSFTEQVGAMRGAVNMVELIDPAMAWRPDVQPTGLSITVELGDPDIAANVANAILDSIVEQSRQRVEEMTSATLDFLIAEEARIQGELSAVEADIAAFRQTNIASLPEGLTAQRERLADLNASILDVDQQLLSLDNASARLREEEVTRQTTLLTEQRALLAQRAAEIEAAIAATPRVEQELAVLLRRQSQHETELEVISTQRTEAATAQRLESENRTARMSELERALPPEFPSSRSRKMIAVAGAMASGMAALGVALALELLSKGIRSADQMKRELGIDPVVVIPRLHRRRRFGGRGLRKLLMGLAALLAALWAAWRWGVIDRIAGLFSRVRVEDRLTATPAE